MTPFFVLALAQVLAFKNYLTAGYTKAFEIPLEYIIFPFVKMRSWTLTAPRQMAATLEFKGIILSHALP